MGVQKLLVSVVGICSASIFFAVKYTVSGYRNDDIQILKTDNRHSIGFRTAVCVSGQLRTLTMLPSNKYHPKSWDPMSASIPFPNQSVAESIQANLFPKLSTTDVFMSVSTRETSREPRRGDLKSCEPLRPRRGLLKCQVQIEEEVTSIGNESYWKYFSNPSTKAIKGFLQQLKGMNDCYRMIEKHINSTGTRYDWIVRLRPDMYIHEFPNIEDLVTERDINRTIFYSSKNTCCCGNEDTFAFGSYQVMVPLLERLVHFQYSNIFSDGEQFSSETHLIKYLNEKGIDLKEHSSIKACLVKPTYRGLSEISIP